MSKGASKCSNLVERNSETEVFQNMDNFELSEACKFDMSIRLQFPKFSKGFSVNDFESFIKSNIGEDNLVAIGRLAFPNEWQMQVKAKDIREKLIRLGRTKINTRTCWISPLSQNEVRGYVHWLPNAISDKAIIDLLNPFGEVLFMEFQKAAKWTKVDSDSRYFAMHLTPGKTMDDLPHMPKVDSHLCLITIRGRRPCCFHCREVGHRKSECKKYREKLQGYCMRKPTDGKRKKPRGKRYKPNLQLTDEQAEASKTDGAKLSQTKPLGKKKAKSSGTKVVAKQNEVIATETASDVSAVILNNLKTLSSVLTNAASSFDTEIEAAKKKLANVHISSEVINTTPTEVINTTPTEVINTTPTEVINTTPTEVINTTPTCDSENPTPAPKKKSKKKKKKKSANTVTTQS